MNDKIFKKILDNPIYNYLADHGAEIDYIIGTLLNDLTSKLNPGRGVIVMSNTLNTVLNVSWNYFDALYDFMLASKQLSDTREYRQTQSKIQAILNIISGTQLLALSYNPLLKKILRLDNAASFATTSFAISAFFDLDVASLELYNTSKELKFEGWVDERIKKINHAHQNGHETKALIKETRSRIKAHIHTNPSKYDLIVDKINSKMTAEGAPRDQITANLQDGAKKHHLERDLRLQYQLEQSYKESRTNFCLKLLSFVGMTLIAISRYIDPDTSAYEATFVIGLTLSSLVASAYFTYNSERLLDGAGTMSHRFFSSCSRTTPSVPDPAPALV